MDEDPTLIILPHNRDLREDDDPLPELRAHQFGSDSRCIHVLRLRHILR